MRVNTIDRIIARFVEKTEGCWLWKGYTMPNGYGQVRNGKTVLAHRAIYEAVKGQIPDGLVLDHLCRNRSCVNPDHLEPVTLGENSRRGLNVSLKTHCANGHPYEGENVLIRKGKNGMSQRCCRICVKDSQKRWFSKKEAA